MSWPLSQDYNEAIQSPATNFADPDLRRGEAVCNALGIPMPYSGNFADVYQVRCPDGSRWAVKCFTREAVGLRERYAEISKHLARVKLPFTVDFTYLEMGIRIAGMWYPVVKMEWIEGLALNQFVAQSLDKPAMLEALVQLWAKMARHLRAADVGHCDLQHGNVLLVPGAHANSLSLKLIDYDGMWVPALRGTKSGEVGHPCYQHPQRLREGTYSIEVDRFPLLLVATSLRVLKIMGKAFWEKYDNGDNMLFTEVDLREPAKSPLLLDLSRAGGQVVGRMTDALVNSLRGPLEATPLLKDVLSEPAAVLQRPTQPAPDSAVPRAPVVARPPAANRMLPFDATEPSTGSGGRQPIRMKERAAAPRTVMWAAAATAALVVVLGGVAAAVVLTARGGEGPRAPQPTAPAKFAQLPGTTADKEADANPIPPTTHPPDGIGENRPQPTEPVPLAPAPSGLAHVWRLPPQKAVSGSAVAPMPERLPIPSDAALSEAAKLVKDVYKTDMKRKPAEVQALVDKMIEDALDANSEPAQRYCLLREARDQAAKAGDVDRCLRAAGGIADHFDVSVREAKTTALETAERMAPNQGSRLTIAEYALAAEDEAQEDDDYDTAFRLARVAGAIAGSLGNKFADAAAQARVREVESLRDAYQSLKPAVMALDTNPNDGDASLALGKYYCLEKGDWDRGLPLLAAGSDAKLKDLAVRDLAGAADADALAAVGDAFKSAADEESGLAKTRLLGRACSWYLLSASKLTGFPLTRMKAKVDEIEKAQPAQRPVVLSAMCGANTSWMDVTDRVRMLLVRSSSQRATFKLSDLGIPTDPAPGQRKALVVVYRYRGWISLNTTGENESSAIPAGSAAIVPPGVPKTGQELTVLHARFGADTGWEDKTANAQDRVLSGTMTASPQDIGFGDPAFGKHKAMVLVYRYRGAVHLSITGESETATIGAPAVKP